MARRASADVMRGYRGGYLPNRRREIERGLREGLRARRRLDQRARARDRHRRARRVGDGRLSRHDCRDLAARRPRRAPDDAIGRGARGEQRADRSVHRPQPVVFLRGVPEHALINPDNLHILLDHVKCAAFELPFTNDEQFGAEGRRDEVDLQAILSVLAEEGFVHQADGQWNWTNESYPADAVSLRSVSSDNFVVVDCTNGERVIGETDFTSGPVDAARKGDLHPRRAAVPGRAARFRRPQGVRARGRLRLLHRRDHVYEGDDPGDVRVDGQATSCRVQRCARASTADAKLDPETEVPSSASRPEPRAGARLDRSHGEVHVVSRVVGFKKIKFYTNENIGSGELDLPEQQMHTSSYWLTIPAAIMATLPYAGDDRRDGVVGLAFAMKNVAQLLLMCDGHDIGLSVDGGSLERSTRTGGMRRRAGSARGRARTSSSTTTIPAASASAGRSSRCTTLLLERTRDLIAGCPCESGCPSCVGPEGQYRAARQDGGARGFSTCCSTRGARPDGSVVAAARHRQGRRAEAGPLRQSARSARADLRAGHRRVRSDDGFDRVADLLGGHVSRTPTFGQCLVIDRRYEADRWHGAIRIGDCDLAMLGDGLDRSLDPALACVAARPAESDDRRVMRPALSRARCSSTSRRQGSAAARDARVPGRAAAASISARSRSASSC